MKKSQTYMEWAEKYSDNSGVEKSVAYNGNSEGKGFDQTIEFRSHGEIVSFDAMDIDWLLYCLKAIKEEQEI